MRRTGFFASLAIVLAAGRLAGQTIEVRLVEDSTRIPVAGGIVRLLAADGRSVGQSLSNDRGVVRFQTVAGTYRLRADRIGFSGILSDPVQVAEAETVRLELLMPSARMLLPTIEVRGRSSCGRAGAGTLAAALWEEIGKALTANVLTEEGRIALLHVREYFRELDRDAKPWREWTFRSALVERQPFGAMPPADLARHGFVRFEDDSTTFAAPDARLLLSDEFVATHCFGATTGSDGLLGLTFEPIRNRKVPDVAGTLWVDRNTSELRFLAYRYTGLGGNIAKADLGGRVEFERVPSGAWFVRYWHIRMPVMTVGDLTDGRRRINPTLAGYLDRGGRAEIAAPGTRPLGAATLIGRIVDSTGGGGLARAVIRVEGTRDSILTDFDGRFSLVTRATGPTFVTAAHPKLALWGQAVRTEAVFSLGDTTRVAFGTPSTATVAQFTCGNDRRTALVGLATDRIGEPDRRSLVSAEWLQASGRANRRDARRWPSGHFAFCNVPAEQDLRITLGPADEPLGTRTVRLAPNSPRWLDLGPGGDPSVEPLIASGVATIFGTVREDSTLRPVGTAEIEIEGAGRRTVTAADGRFRIDSLVPTAVIVAVRANGFRPYRQWVTLAPAGAAEFGAVVERPDAGDTGAPLGVDGFEARRALGSGRFLDAAALRRTDGVRFGDVIGQESGVRVARTASGAVAVGRRAEPSRDRCPMTLYLDGAVYYSPRPVGPSAAPPPPPDLDLFDGAGLTAVEIYRTAAEVPPGYRGTGTPCGALLLWSRP